MITLGMLDDHPLITAGIRNMFENDTEACICWAISLPDTLTQQLTREPVDVLLLDVNLTLADGLVICKQLCQQYPALHIIMLTSYEETNFVRAAFRNGASGYLLKNASYAEISEAVQVVCRGERYIARRMRDLLLADGLGLSATTAPGYSPLLTRRELDVLLLIVQELTNQEMADQLCISAKTIETHRMNLIQKMGVKNTAGLVRVAMQKGLV